MRRQRVSRRASVSRFFGDAGRLRPSQLLASTAIVAAGMIAGGVALPAAAVAAPVCTGTSDFICNGTGLTITLAESLIPEDGPFSVLIGPDPELPFVQHVTSTGTAFTINADGYSTHGDGIHMYAGSSIFADPETGLGTGLWIMNPGSNVEAFIDGASDGAAAASIIGTTGIYVSDADSTGHVHIYNSGHVRGTAAVGIEANGSSGEDGLIFDLDNHSYGSTIGETDGVYVHDLQSTQINNGNGLIAGLDGNGVHIENIYNDNGGRNAVNINNNNIGIIAGSSNGISITGTITGEDGDIHISNGAGYNVDNDVLEANAGGFILGQGGAGVYISGSISGHVGIDNSGTRGATVDPSALGLDPLVYSGSSGLVGSFADGAGLNGRLPLGIYGQYTGVYVSGASNDVDINNNAYVATQAWDNQLEDDVTIAPHLVGGGSIISYGTGVYVEDVSEYVNVNNDNDRQFVAGDIGTTGGLIIGFNEDGVDVFDVENGVSVNNNGGTIYGGYNGVQVANVGEDGVSVENGAGRIIGYDNVGVYIGDAADINISRARVDNWAWPEGATAPTYGGHIIGSQQGVLLAADNVSVGNGPGGAILGLGSEGQISEEGYQAVPVVDLHSWDHASVDNYGIIASTDVPHFDWYGEYSYSFNGSNIVEDPGYTLDTAAIAADVSQFGTFAWSGGQTGSLTRGSTSLADYGTAAHALAIQSSGETEDGYYSYLQPGGGADVTNETSGILIGRVEMFSNSENSEDGGASVRNFGTWYAQDQAETYNGLGYAAALYSEDGFSGIDNAGLVQTAFSSSTQEAAHFLVRDGFQNGGYWSDGPVASPGLLSAIDGGVGDGIYILNGPSEDGFGSYLHNGGDFHGSTGGALTSFIGLDANLSPGTVEDPMTDNWSDPSLWRSDRFAAGIVSGSTGLIINKVNSTSTNLIGDTVILAHANYINSSEDGGDPGCATDTCKAGDPFYIAPQSKGYVEVGGVGAVQDGAYAWFLHAVGTAPDPDYIVVSDWSPADVQIPGLVTGAQNIWYDTSGVVADHIYGNHFPQAGEGGGGADLPVGVAPPTVPTAKPAVSIWGKFSGDHFNRTTAVTETLGGVTSSINTSLVQDTFSLLGGADFQPNGDGDGIRAGAFAGVVGSSLSFSSYGATATYQGGTIGGYAAYTRDGFYVDAEAKIDALNMTYSGGGLTANAWSTSAGILANAGYRMQMGDAFIEPVASASYVNTTIQNLGLSGATVSFSNGQSFRLGAGAKVGTTVQVNDEMSAELALQGKLWDELGPANKITITDGFGNSTTFSDNISGLFGEISASATVYNLDKSMSGFVTVADKFNGSFNNASIKGGIRKTF